jgi:dTDP-4-amino-4,6-dideoxygalactose transaminase
VSPHDDFRRAVGDVIGVPGEHVALFWKGRVALYALLRALGVGPGDEVVVPAFTCVVVPNAIIYAGAVPVYADIDDVAYTVDAASVAAVAGPRTRAILAQNTFGLSADLDALRAIADRHGAVLLDDSTHGLGGTYRDQPNGAAADAAFYSTQWSKPISTGLGGIAATSDPMLARDLRALETAARTPSATEQAKLRALVAARDHLATPRTLRAGRAVYRALGRRGLVPGSSSGAELAAPVMPSRYVTAMSSSQAELGCRRIRTLDEAVRVRRAVAARYSSWLTERSLRAACEQPGMGHAFLRYPLRVRERGAFLDAAARAGLSLGDWFGSPLYPIDGDLTTWGYRRGAAPVAEKVTAEIVNLPTDLAPDGRELQAVLRFLSSSADRIL